MYVVFTRMPSESYRRREDVPLVDFMYLVFTCMPGESYRRRLRSLLYLCDVFRACVDSAQSLWASFCFRFEINLRL